MHTRDANQTHTHRWYGVFTIFKGVAVGIALGTLTTAEANSGFVFGIFSLNLLVQIIFRPQMDVYAFATELYTSAVQVCVCVCGWVGGWVSMCGVCIMYV